MRQRALAAALAVARAVVLAGALAVALAGALCGLGVCVLACGSAPVSRPAPSAARSAARSAPRVAAPVPREPGRPRVVLDDAGSAPRSLLRYAPRLGGRSEVVATVDELVTLPGASPRPGRLPRARASFGLVAEPLPGRGGWELRFDGDAAAATSLVLGPRGIDGARREALLPPPQSRQEIPPYLEATHYLGSIDVPLPEQAVGVGARWTVVSDVVAPLPGRLSDEYLLIDLGEGRVTVLVLSTLEPSAAALAELLAALEREGAAVQEAYVGELSVASVALNALLPRRETYGLLRVVLGPAGAQQEITLRRRWSLTSRARPDERLVLGDLPALGRVLRGADATLATRALTVVAALDERRAIADVLTLAAGSGPLAERARGVLVELTGSATRGPFDLAEAARAFIDAGDDAAALPLLDQALGAATGPDGAVIRLVRAELHRRMGHPSSAHDDYLGAAAQAPDDGVVLAAAAWWLAVTAPDSHRDLPKARALAERAVRREPHQPDLLDTLAVACSALGDHACAVSAETRALAVSRKAGASSQAIEALEGRLRSYRDAQRAAQRR